MTFILGGEIERAPPLLELVWKIAGALIVKVLLKGER